MRTENEIRNAIKILDALDKFNNLNVMGKAKKEILLWVLAKDFKTKKKKVGIDRLDRWKKQYDFNCQLYNGDYTIYVSKDDVDVFEAGGHLAFKDAVDVVIKWLERVNKKK